MDEAHMFFSSKGQVMEFESIPSDSKNRFYQELAKLPRGEPKSMVGPNSLLQELLP